MAKFPPFILDYIVNDSFECIRSASEYKSRKDYYGFEPPFDNDDPYDDDVTSTLEKYVKDVGLELVDDTLIDVDPEKGIQYHDIVFRYKRKFYKFEYYWNIYWSSLERDGYNKDISEVFPHKKTIIEYY